MLLEVSGDKWQVDADMASMAQGPPRPAEEVPRCAGLTAEGHGQARDAVEGETGEVVTEGSREACALLAPAAWEAKAQVLPAVAPLSHQPRLSGPTVPVPGSLSSGTVIHLTCLIPVPWPDLGYFLP